MSEDKFLDGKRVLFLSYDYYDYHIHIRDTLKKAGAFVDTYSVWKYNSIYEKSVFTFLRHLSKKLFFAYNNAYNRNILKEISGRKYDYVLVISGYQLSDEFYVELRRLNPEAMFVNYNWDSVRETMYGNTYIDKMSFFDKVYSFDRKDCETYENLQYLPLFYTEEYEKIRKDSSDVQQDIDLLFIGSLCQYRRYFYVKEVEKLCLTQGIKFVHYLGVSKRFYLRNLLRGRRLSNVHFKSLSGKEIVEYYRRSKAIIDLPHHTQTGLTMRVFEVLGTGKKLITANRNITKEPFYNNEKILLIDQDNLSVDKDFIRASSTNWDCRIEEYSIFNWLRKIFS